MSQQCRGWRKWCRHPASLFKRAVCGRPRQAQGSDEFIDRIAVLDRDLNFLALDFFLNDRKTAAASGWRSWRTGIGRRIVDVTTAGGEQHLPRVDVEAQTIQLRGRDGRKVGVVEVPAGQCRVGVGEGQMAGSVGGESTSTFTLPNCWICDALNNPGILVPFRFLANDESNVISLGRIVPAMTSPSPPNGPSDLYPDGAPASAVI